MVYFKYLSIKIYAAMVAILIAATAMAAIATHATATTFVTATAI